MSQLKRTEALTKIFDLENPKHKPATKSFPTTVKRSI